MLTGNANSFGSGTGVGGCLLVRLDSSGAMLWSKGYGGANQEQATNVLELPNGYLIATGNTSTYGLGVSDAFMIKTDDLGNLIWSKNYGGSGTEIYYSASLLGEGNILAIGFTTSYGAGNDDILVSKIDTNGVVLWSKTYGGSNIDRGEQVIESANGEIMIAGYTNSFGAGGYDKTLLSVDNLGNVNWSKVYGGLNDDEVDRYADPMVVAQDRGILLVGGTKNFGLGDENIYIVKTNTCGETFCNDNNVNFSVTSPVIIGTNSNASTAVSGNFSAIVSTVNTSTFTEATLCDSNLVGINNAFNEPINSVVAPNPNNGQFNVVINNNDISLIEVYDVLGKQVFTKSNVNTNKVAIDLTSQTKGIYFVKLTIGNQVFNEKVIYQE
ncbi:MAG: T9SS type A sorting domain-containing protein [Vicingus serpentipes]|nr:T9SS type A sorting domain-containing protein [Vicingus serpentipes]